MPLVSFSVFKEKIENGSKKQTIRKLRKYPIKKYDLLYMWWKSRTPQRERLGFSTCTEEFLIKMSIINNGYSVYLRVWPVGSVEELSQEQYEELAKQDGFSCLKEMTEWFYKTHGEMEQECFQVIRWDKLVKNHQFTQTVILDIVKEGGIHFISNQSESKQA